LLLAIVSISPAAADVVEIGAMQDNTLYEDLDGDGSNGAGIHFFAGTTFVPEIRRGVIAFDVAGAVPEGATIDTVTLTLHMSKTIVGPQVVALHRILADWGEGTSDAPFEEGIPAVAERGDATWVHRFFPTVEWASTGGDFDAAPSGDSLIANIGFYTWGSAGMVADVQSWLDSPDDNFGWIVIGNEATFPTAKRFDSRENSDESERPVLTVEFSGGPDVPASSAAGRILLTVALLAAGTLLVSRYRSARNH
jgi:hypothetical protein